MVKKKFWLQILCIGVVVSVCLGIGIWICCANTFTLQVNVAGEQEVILQYGETYEDLGATAEFSGTLLVRKPQKVDVATAGHVDTSKPGTYEIQYTATHNNLVTTACRKVHVVDAVAPEIALTTNPDAYTIPGQPYQEEGFAATDNADGDLTAAVEAVEENGVVTYTVTDSSGNTTTVTRQIVYLDPIPPELTLQGNTTVTMTAGHAYQEPGYKATDNCDGDISANVVVSGAVDIYKPGTYTLTYTVSDSYANTVSLSRTVVVVAPVVETQPTTTTPEQPAPTPTVPPVEQPAGKVIYLTFDDGPGPHTGRLLDVLAKYNAKATFFVVNTAYIGDVARMAQEGHAIGIHSTTHKYNEIYASDEAFFNDLYTMQAIIENISGVKTTLLRFPGGSSNTTSAAYSSGIMTRLTQAVQEQGFQYFDWNVDSRDAGGAWDADSVFYNVINSIGSKQASIVLQHDIKGYSVDAVEKILIWGIANGYSFQALTPTSPNAHHRVNN